MSGRNYYYLVAGLPDLVLEQSKLALDFAEFKLELRHHLSAFDYKLVELILLPIDNKNLLHLLLKTNEEFIPNGKYSLEILEEEMKNPKILPDYLRNFILHFKEEQPVYPELSWEDQLTAIYLEYAAQTKNKFVSNWIKFERNVRNIMAALTARKFKLNARSFIIGNDEFSQTLIKSQARDFGLAQQFPYIEKLIQIFETNNLLEREKSLDLLRWSYLDELNTFHYFSIEIILAFILKFQMVQRWLRLDKEAGLAIFRRLLEDLENSYEFPKEFS
ncbi:MAG TPA: DUF2764 family protein [Bacteroidales bacterium]|jgi:hypothetical protein|nr:DUF2764 family protein [Bacteroidales bacterium]MDI9573802.1 DUF2764 family protein [Bacteroidota bacterium]MBP9511087.1 DUF2764 family protein [Bacteroidales bacterium]MBP9588044.1 DUF2764 family protein [Bacteroidales bacterium]NMD15797.1 DUF2764 family protein [Bacteroidales bacterium]